MAESQRKSERATLYGALAQDFVKEHLINLRRDCVGPARCNMIKLRFRCAVGSSSCDELSSVEK
jgi:hypothetical protein